MKKIVHYKQGYKIVITNKFYEVSDGKALTHFGELRHKPTLQEVWNKTIGLKQQEERIAANRRRTQTNNQMDNIANCYR